MSTDEKNMELVKTLVMHEIHKTAYIGRYSKLIVKAFVLQQILITKYKASWNSVLSYYFYMYYFQIASNKISSYVTIAI